MQGRGCVLVAFRPAQRASVSKEQENQTMRIYKVFLVELLAIQELCEHGIRGVKCELAVPTVRQIN